MLLTFAYTPSVSVLFRSCWKDKTKQVEVPRNYYYVYYANTYVDIRLIDSAYTLPSDHRHCVCRINKNIKTTIIQLSIQLKCSQTDVLARTDQSWANFSSITQFLWHRNVFSQYIQNRKQERHDINMQHMFSHSMSDGLVSNELIETNGMFRIFIRIALCNMLHSAEIKHINIHISIVFALVHVYSKLNYLR